VALRPADIPMGATVGDGGTYFRVWAPGAEAVHVALVDPAVSSLVAWQAAPTNVLTRDASGFWSGFFPGVGRTPKWRTAYQQKLAKRSGTDGAIIARGAVLRPRIADPPNFGPACMSPRRALLAAICRPPSASGSMN
jgi:hypothetical protein